MRFTREIHHLLIGILIAFAIVGISATYWSIIGSDTLLQRDDNPRLVEAEAAILRGSIVDRNGELLASSTQDENQTVTRHYYHPETDSALGYYSMRYGVDGIEAAYNAILRGDDLDGNLTTYFQQDILHHPQVGSDIRVTLDLTVQKEVVNLMSGKTGAVIVMAVPSGEVLALVSLPTYDPNTLDDEWENLISAPGKPFFNRVIQGNYQPGGLLQTPLMAEALLTRQEVDTVFDSATAPIKVDDVELACAMRPSTNDLTLAQAYIMGCPRPFSQFVRGLDIRAVENTFKAFGLLDAPLTLTGYIAEPITAEATPEATPPVTSVDDLVKQALGQGQLTVTPLNMAAMVAAIINKGNAPQPYTLLEVRRPDETDWTPTTDIRPTIPFITEEIAHQLQNLMRAVVIQGAAQAADQPGITIGGHTSRAYSGEGTQVWFIGFATLDDEHGIVTAVIIENSDDLQIASSIGGQALKVASSVLTSD